MRRCLSGGGVTIFNHPLSQLMMKGIPGTIHAMQRLTADELPLTECLKDTVARFLPFWHDEAVPAIKSGKQVIIAAHGNSIRALVKYLDNVPESEIVELNIPTGVPLVYELDKDLKPIKHYYLGDPEEARKKAEAVANQAKSEIRKTAENSPPLFFNFRK